MITKYTIEVSVNEEWLRNQMKDVPQVSDGIQYMLELWAEIATAGTGISVYTVYKTKE